MHVPSLMHKSMAFAFLPFAFLAAFAICFVRRPADRVWMDAHQLSGNGGDPVPRADFAPANMHCCAIAVGSIRDVGHGNLLMLYVWALFCLKKQ